MNRLAKCYIMNKDNDNRYQQIDNLPETEGPVKLDDLTHAKNPNPVANSNIEEQPNDTSGIAKVGTEITDGAAG